MTNAGVYVSRLSAWAPGVSSSAEWDEWALGNRHISPGNKGPELSFAEPMFRRRLSQISKMTIQVIHNLMPIADDTKIIFISFRGELTRQYQINKMLIEEKTLSPAAFSLSVFNAPVALASMALGLKGGYSAIYPGDNSFSFALQAAAAALLCGTAEELVFVYADEEVQPEYGCFFNEVPPAASFGLLLSKNPHSNSVPFFSTDKQSPLDFLKQLIHGGIRVSP
jgi:hypothetical protein